MRGLPHRTLRSLAASHGPVMLLRLGRAPTVVVSSAAAAEEALKTRDLAFASRPRMLMAERLAYNCDMIFAPYGNYWRQARRVCVLHLLTPRRIAAFRRVREEAVTEFLGRIRAEACAHSAGLVNLRESITCYTSAIITRAAFGLGNGGDCSLDGDDGGAKIRQALEAIMELIVATPMREIAPWLGWVDTLTGLEAKTERTVEVLDVLFERIIAEHRSRRRLAGGGDQNDHRDFVDVLLDVNEMDEEAGLQLDNDKIKALISNMFVAGAETSNTVLEWAMAELVNHPHKMKTVQDEIRTVITNGGTRNIAEDHLANMPYLKAVISETLRLHPPGPLLVPHETTEATELLGYHIPASTRVVINAWAIGRDPTMWERAEEFVPERFMSIPMDYRKIGNDFRFLAFGAGRRGCPGAGFAAPLMELVLANMLYHFHWEPAPSIGRMPGAPASVVMSERFGLSVRLKTPLMLVAKPWYHDV